MKYLTFRKYIILTFFLILCGIGYLYWSHNRVIELEIGIYSGNAWGVPQVDVYRIYDEAIALFETKHPNVRITYRSGTLIEDYSEWMAQGVLKGQEPDIMIVLEEDFDAYVQIGLLEPLDYYIENDTDFSQGAYYALALSAGARNALQYALPMQIVPSFMIANETLLSRAGFSMPDPDWAYDTFLELVEALTRDTNGDGQINQYGSYGYNWEHIYYGHGFTFLDRGRNRDWYDGDGLKKAIDTYRGLESFNSGYYVSRDDFMRGDVAFKTFTFAEFRAYHAYPYRIRLYDDFTWVPISLPKFNDESEVAKLYTVQLGMSQRSRHKKLAWEFIKDLCYDEQIQQMVWDYTYTLPARVRVVEKNLNMDEVLNSDFLEDIINNSFIEPSYSGFKKTKEQMDDWILIGIMKSEDSDTIIRRIRHDLILN